MKLPGVGAVDLGGLTEAFVTNRRLLLSASGSSLLFGQCTYAPGENAKSWFPFRSDVFRANAPSLVFRSRGQVVESEDIQFENVPIITRNGDILVKTQTCCSPV